LKCSASSRVSFTLSVFAKLGCKLPPFIKAGDIAQGDEVQKNELSLRLLDHFITLKACNSALKTENPDLGVTHCDNMSKDYLDPLIRWFDAIAQKYASKVSNLYSDLADGRVFCLVLHYYFPDFINYKSIQDSSFSEDSSEKNNMNSFYSFTSHEKAQRMKISKIRRNYKLINEALEKILGMPKISTIIIL
jgi:hypothetical protein